MPSMWREFVVGESTRLGAKSHCPFCKARLAKEFAIGELAMALAGEYAGYWGKVSTVSYHKGDQNITLNVDHVNLQTTVSTSKKRNLICRLDDLDLPRWLPPLRLRYLSQFEEFVHGFCVDLEVGAHFQWRDDAAAWLVSGTWYNMLPVSGNEVATAAVAHGLPSHFQAKLAELFDFGRDCLVAGAKRAPQKVRRKPGEIEKIFSEALRYSYRW